jgi:AcrR family transcriptional regulator
MPRKTKSPEQIIEAASELFFTYGYGRVTVDEVATNLAISKKTLYKHFASKEDLLMAVMETFYAEIQTGIDNIHSDPGLNFDERFRRFVQLLGQRMAQIGASQQDIRRQAPEVWQRIEELRQQIIFGELSKLVAEGQKSNAFRPEFDPELHSTLLTMWMQAAANSDILARFSVSASDVVEMMLDIYLQGVVSRNP